APALGFQQGFSRNGQTEPGKLGERVLSHTQPDPLQRDDRRATLLAQANAGSGPGSPRQRPARSPVLARFAQHAGSSTLTLLRRMRRSCGKSCFKFEARAFRAALAPPGSTRRRNALAAALPARSEEHTSELQSREK